MHSVQCTIKYRSILYQRKLCDLKTNEESKKQKNGNETWLICDTHEVQLPELNWPYGNGAVMKLY